MLAPSERGCPVQADVADGGWGNQVGEFDLSEARHSGSMRLSGLVEQPFPTHCSLHRRAHEYARQRALGDSRDRAQGGDDGRGRRVAVQDVGGDVSPQRPIGRRCETL